MTNKVKKRVFFVDDEKSVCKAVKATLISKYEVTCFNEPKSCLNALDNSHCHLLISDLTMPDMNGLELLKKIKAAKPGLPVLILTGYGSIPSAVEAVKEGAADFIEKPIDADYLLQVIENTLDDNKMDHDLLGKTLTPTETEILKYTVEGLSNKQISNKISRSVRTVEDHRCSIMHKIGAANTAEMVRIGMKMKLE